MVAHSKLACRARRLWARERAFCRAVVLINTRAAPLTSIRLPEENYGLAVNHWFWSLITAEGLQFAHLAVKRPNM